MNGIDLAKPSGPPPDLVRLVEQLMAGVIAGRISSLACVTVSPLGDVASASTTSWIWFQAGINATSFGSFRSSLCATRQASAKRASVSRFSISFAVPTVGRALWITGASAMARCYHARRAEP